MSISGLQIFNFKRLHSDCNTTDVDYGICIIYTLQNMYNILHYISNEF